MQLLKTKIFLKNYLTKRNMNSDFFEINRFGKVMKREFYGLSHSKYLLLSIIAGVVLFLLLIYNINPGTLFQASERADKYIGITKFLFLLTSILSYKNINHPQKGLVDTMLPASTFEKFLKMQIFSFVIFPLGFLSIAISFDMIFSLALSDEIFYMILPSVITSLSKISITEIWFILFYAQLLFLLNLFLKSHKLLKTLVFIVISHLALFILIIIVSFLIATKGDIFTDTFNKGVYNYDIDLDELIWNSSLCYIGIIISYVIIASLMVGSYFKLKSLRY